MTWWQKWWKWVVGIFVLIGIFLAGFFSRRPKILSPSQDMEEEKKKIEEEAKGAEEAVEKEKVDHLEEINKAHESKLQDFSETQKENTKKLEENPDEINGWLLEVGRKERE